MSYQYVITSDSPITECGQGRIQFGTTSIKIQELSCHGPLKDVNQIMDMVKYFVLGRGDEYFELKIKNTVIKAVLDSAPTILEATG